ncbi:MAG: hypothetical protein J7604_07670 [Sporocytophaga sp.]|uniref:hypothetical protein n=1 Tax=Sporocytophaga sp. TaxID=2231183 RepID=UPI001B193612|nr:hypothetical protein [Sporocytophaga sp.]MBO9700074.1 hypothetical protein [Sporocytophaga sp.]
MRKTICTDSVGSIMLKPFAFLFLMILVVSCKPKITDVSISNEIISSSKVVLDDTLLLKVLPESLKYTTIPLSVGVHSVTINGGKKESFKVTEEGGILNLGRQEFVIFPITYTNTTTDDVNHAIVSANYPILLADSLVVYNKDVANSQAELIQLLQNENVKDFLNRDLIKVPADQLFISKSWDFDVDQNPSDSISVKVKSKDTKTHGFRSKITDAQSFLRHAKLSNEYEVERVENRQQLESLLKKSEE